MLGGLEGRSVSHEEAIKKLKDFKVDRDDFDTAIYDLAQKLL